MFLTLDVVNKQNTTVKDLQNRSIIGHKAVIEKEIVNMKHLVSVQKLNIEDKFPKHEMFGKYDISLIEDKPVCLLTFSFGNITSEKIVACDFEKMQNMLQGR